MTNGIRKAAFQAPWPSPAEPMLDNPATRLEAMYRRIWTTSIRDLPFVNLALSVEAVGFRRWQLAGTGEQLIDSTLANDSTPAAADVALDSSFEMPGDWVGALITPWFVNLFVLPGGGDLWSDLRSGERCHIVFPIGPLEFIADDDPTAEVPAYQYCPLFAPPGQFASQAAARAAAMAALDAMFGMPASSKSNTTNAAAKQVPPPRRVFFRRVARR